MFTGIVEELGTVHAVTKQGDCARIEVHAPLVLAGAKAGDSIAVNGVCLTVVETDGSHFVADVMGETLHRTTLGGLHQGSRVNCERPATLATRLGGHLVQGHVDGVAQVIERIPGDDWETVKFSMPANLGKYVVEKGSITVDGVSLTVMAVDDTSFSVGLIPTTLQVTTLGAAAVGTSVNLEADMIAKHVEKLLKAGDR